MSVDGKHCPNCTKDVDWLSVVLMASPERVRCPSCAAYLEFNDVRRFRLAYLTASLAIIAGALNFAGVPALVAALLGESNPVPEEEVLVQLLACVALLYGAGVAIGCAATWYLRTFHELILAPTPRWYQYVPAKILRFMVGMPLSLRYFLGCMVLSAIASVLLIGLPICRQQMGIWHIQRAGGVVRAQRVMADPRQWLPGGDRWLHGTVTWIEITLEGFDIKDDNLACVTTHLKELDVAAALFLSQTRISDRGLTHLRGLKNLRRLWLAGMDPRQVTFLGVNPQDFQFSDTGIQHLQELPRLVELNLEDTLVTDAGLPHLSGLADLHTLWLNGTPVTGAGLAHLDGLKRLNSLRLQHCALTDDGLAGLSNLQGLTHLFLANTPITDAGLVHLRNLTALNCLRLDGTQVTGAGLHHLADLPVLRTLGLNDTPVADSGLAQLSELTHLESLSLRRTQIGVAGMKNVGKATGLKYLDLGDTHIADNDLVHLKEMESLQALILDKTSVVGSGLEHLCDLPVLASVNLDGTEFSDAELERLTGLNSLQSVRVESTRVTDAGVDAMKKKRPKLHLLK